MQVLHADIQIVDDKGWERRNRSHLVFTGGRWRDWCCADGYHADKAELVQRLRAIRLNCILRQTQWANAISRRRP